MNKYDLVIIGGGSGGLSMAAGAAKIGLRTLLVDKRKLGGDCLWFGCIPSKVLIHEAEKIRTISTELYLDNFKLDYDKHFKEAQNRILQVQQAISEHDSVKRFTDLGIDVIIGEAKFVSENEVSITDNFGQQKNAIFKKCVVATGSSPRIPELYNNIKYLTNETFFDMKKLPESMIIVGGGSIGVEMGSAMAMFGVQVSMILKEDRIMPKEEIEIGNFMMERMSKDLGIKFYKNAEIEKVEQVSNSEIKLKIKGGELLSAETLLLCVGRKYNTNLNLEKANITYSEKGIDINEYLQTSNKNVYAIGDVNGYRLFTHAAGYQARAALQNILIPSFVAKILPILKKKSLPKAFPWVTYTYPEVAHVGEYKKDLDLNKIVYKEYVTKLESVDRAKTATINKDGFISVLVSKGKNEGRILGVTIVAPHAGELITEWVLAMENNLKVDAIFNTVHAYPTLSELNPRSTFEYMGEKITPFRLKILRLLFRL